MRFYSLVTAAALLSASFAAHASLIGNTVSCNQTSSSSGYSCNSSTATVGSGPEFTLILNGGTGSDITEDFTANGLTVTFESGLHFNATNIVNADLTSAFTGYSVTSITGFTGLSASNISLNNGLLDLNLVGSESSPGASINLALTTAATPEPSSLALLGTGILGALGVARKRFA